MSDVLALSMLYEILVSESKYESRGIDYRTKLKALYHQLLKERQVQNDSHHKISKQSSNKLLECLSDAVRVLDPTQIQPTDLELCYGIHQYVFPKIPDFNTLDIRFVSKWNKFYNAFPAYSKLPDRKSKRQNEKQKSYQMSKRRYARESDSSSESDESDSVPDLPVLMTEDDFGNEESEFKNERTDELDGLAKVEDPGANMPMEGEPEGHVKLPLVMNKDVEITEDSIVFGLMDDEKLTEWVSTSSMHNYDELYKEMYSCDPTLKYFLTQSKDSKPREESDVFDLLAREANLDVDGGPEYDETGRAEYLTEDDTDDSLYFKEYKSDLSDGCGEFKSDCVETMSATATKTESLYSSSSTTNSEEMNDQLIGTGDFYKEVKVKTLPGNYKQNTEKFEVESIFGNYYCPVSSTASDNTKDEQQSEFVTVPKKRGRPRKKNPQTPSSTTLVDSLDKMDSLNSCSDAGVKSEQTELGDRLEQFERVDPSNLMNVKTFTVNFMEVESTYSCNNTGGFEVRCSARIKDPFVSGIMKGKMDPAMGVYQELQEMLKKLFSLKKKITGNCSVCSGWNLLHGIAQSFCEYCEDKLANSDPELILKIFEIRRQLVSNLYPIVGYKYETLDLFSEGDLVENWKELLNQQKVSIQSLSQIGASFPKASLHDSRYLPTPVTLPVTMCNTINTFQYPKSNLNMLPIQINLNALTKEELDLQVNTPTKNYPYSLPFTNNTYQTSNASSYHETCSNSSKCGAMSWNDSLSFDGKDYSDKSSRRLLSYGLMDIVNQRRYNRAKMFNDFFEDIYNAYHSKTNLRKSSQLINNYNNILRHGLLLSSHLVGPYTEPSDDEDESDSDSSSSSQTDREDSPVSNTRSKKKERELNNKKLSLEDDEDEDTESEDDSEEEQEEEEVKKERGYKKNRENKVKKENDSRNKNKEDKENKSKVKKEQSEDNKTRTEDNRLEKEKEKDNYYDEEVSFVLSRLPLDTDMIKLSFYHRGVFLSKRSNTKSYTFVRIGKIFGFKEVLGHPVVYSSQDKDDTPTSVFSSSTDSNTDSNTNTNTAIATNTQDPTTSTPDNSRSSQEMGTPLPTTKTPDSVKDRYGVSSQSPFENCVFTDPDYVNEFETKPQDKSDKKQNKNKNKDKDKEDKENKNKKKDNKVESDTSEEDMSEEDTQDESTAVEAVKKENKSKLKKELGEDNKTRTEDNRLEKEKEKEDETQSEDNDTTNLNHLGSGRSNEFGNMVFNYNWHELLYRNLCKRPSLADNQVDNLKLIRQMLNIEGEEVDCFDENDGVVELNEEYLELNSYSDLNSNKDKDTTNSSKESNKDDSNRDSNNRGSNSSSTNKTSTTTKNDNNNATCSSKNSNTYSKNGTGSSNANNEYVEMCNYLNDLNKESRENDSRNKNKEDETQSEDNDTSQENNENNGFNFNRNGNNVVNMQIMRMMYEHGMLQNMPMSIVNNLYNSGKLKVGFPTSLEMYMLNMPDSIMDCTMYGGVGKGFLYSLDTIVNNLTVLSSTIRVGTVSDKRRRFSKT